MATLHGEEVSIGDPVWHVRNGWGEVSGLDVDNDTNYPILVHWGGVGKFEWFSEDGKFHKEDQSPTLFWQPIKFEIPKKPKQNAKKEKAWQWICKTGDEYWLTERHHTSEDPDLRMFSNTQIIEPYLPSEIEREVKG